MNLYVILQMMASLLLLSLGLVIAIQGSRAQKAYYKIVFASGCICCFIWLFSFSLMYLTKDKNTALFLSKVGVSGAIFTAMTFHHFIVLLLNRHERSFIILTYFLGAIFTVLTWLPGGLIEGFYKYEWGYYPDFMRLNILSVALFAFLFARGAWLSYFGYRSKQRQGFTAEANRIVYIFWGFVVGPIAGIDYLPGYGFNFYPFGFLIMTFWVCIISYAILRHQLMDIEVIIKKTLVFAGLFGFVFGIIVVVALLTQEFIAQYVPHSRYLALAISAVIIILLHNPVYNFLISATNKFLFQKKYDPRKILREFSDEVLTILNLDRLCKVTIEALVKNLYLTNCAILLLTRDEIGYEIYDSFGIEKKDTYFLRESELVKWLQMRLQPLLYQSYDKKFQASDNVKKEMEKIGSQFCMPLVIQKDMVGILSLGVKKSDQPYMGDDIDILSTFIKTLSIAISNAKLFAQAAQYEKLAAIGTLASGINHEVCNPLNNISTQMQIFVESRKRDIYKDKTSKEVIDEAEKIMQNSIKEIQRVAGITTKLSSFAKPGKDQHLQPINVRGAVEDALGVVGHELKLNKVDIVKDIPKDLPDIMADGHQIQQIFFNLIRNAAQAIEGKGTVTITAEECADKIDIKISDTGCGIPEDRLRKIFEPFYTTKEKGGSGFGLSIVQELVWRNNGIISVESEVGKGTTFYLEFTKA